MADSDKPTPPNAIEDLRKGLGLLFRAAKTTIEKLPTGQIEEAVISGAKEVGRALENVTHSVEEQFLRKPSARPTGTDASKGETDTVSTSASSTSSGETGEKPPEDADKKRVG